MVGDSNQEALAMREARLSRANAPHRRHRGHNLDIFGRPPAAPLTISVDVWSGHILDSVAKHTLHAICLTHFPTGCMLFTVRCLLYADCVEGVSRDDVIIGHVASNYSDWLYEIR